MPYMETITEGQAIVIAEALLDKRLVHPAMISGRRELVDCIIDAGRVEIGQVFTPAGDYEDWFEEFSEGDTLEDGDDPIMVRTPSPAESQLAAALLRVIDEASGQGKEV